MESSITEEQQHYQSLRSYFESLVRYTLLALGVLIGVGFFLFYRDLSQARSEARATVERAREDARDELRKISRDAASVARDEAKKSVEDAFKNTNVTTLIEDAARKQLGAVLARKAKEEADRAMLSIGRDVSSLSEVTNAAMKMRVGLRSGLVELDEQQRNGRSEMTRAMAKSFFESIASDYEAVIQEALKDRQLKPRDALNLAARRTNPTGTQNPAPELIDVIERDSDVNRIALAFVALREATGVKFGMFDLYGVRRWCDRNKKECGKA